MICPACGGEVKAAAGDREGARRALSCTQMRIIFNAVAERPRTKRQLEHILWGGRHDGGPVNPANALSSLISQANRKIAPYRLRIGKSKVTRKDVPHGLPFALWDV